MNKDDILEMSRKENKNGDEREEKIQLRSYAASAGIGACLCFIVMCIEGFIFDRHVAHIGLIYSGMLFSKALIDAIKLKKRADIISAAFWGIFSVALLVLYALGHH